MFTLFENRKTRRVHKVHDTVRESQKQRHAPNITSKTAPTGVGLGARLAEQGVYTKYMTQFENRSNNAMRLLVRFFICHVNTAHR